MTAPTFIGSGEESVNGTASGSAASFTVAQHASTQVGDLLLLIVAVNEQVAGSTNPDISVPSGFTALHDSGILDDNSLNATRYETFYREAADAGAASHTINLTFTAGTPAYAAAALLVSVRGHKTIANGGPFDTAAATSTGVDQAATFRNIDFLSVTASVATDLLLVLGGTQTFGSSTTDESWTPPSGMTTAGASDITHTSQTVKVAGAYLAVGAGATGAKEGQLALNNSSESYGSATGVSILIALGNVAPNAPTWTTPSGVADVAASLVLAAPFSDLDAGDSPGAYALKRTVGATTRWWDGTDWDATTEVKNVSSAESWTIPSGWGADGDAEHLYFAKFWDILDAEGSYSAALYITPSAKVNPTLDEPDHGDTVSTSNVTLEWTVAQQTAYKARILSAASAELWTSGWVTSAVVRSLTPGYTLTTGVSYKAELTTKNTEGLESTADVNDFTVSFTPPATPTATATANTPTGAITVTASHPSPSGGQPTVAEMRVHRRETSVGGVGAWIKVMVSGVFSDTVPPAGSGVDYAIRSGVSYDYRVEALGDNNTVAFSAWT